MKKSIFYVAMFLLTISISSCSKDDGGSSSPASLVGKWEISQVGYIDKTVSMTDENLVAYIHGCVTKKDYTEFTNSEMKQKFYFDCNDTGAPETYTYVYANGKITSIQGGVPETAEVTLLTSTTLKLNLAPGQNYGSIYVFKKVN